MQHVPETFEHFDFCDRRVVAASFMACFSGGTKGSRSPLNAMVGALRAAIARELFLQKPVKNANIGPIGQQRRWPQDEPGGGTL